MWASAISLPTCSGNCDEYPYIQLANKWEQIGFQCGKTFYLESMLKDQVVELISSLPVSESNYPPAWYNNTITKVIIIIDKFR